MKIYVQKFYSAGEHGPFSHYSISKQSNIQSNAKILSEIPEIFPLIKDSGERTVDISEEEMKNLIEISSEPNLIGINENLIKHRVGKMLWSRSVKSEIENNVLKEFVEYPDSAWMGDFGLGR